MEQDLAEVEESIAGVMDNAGEIVPLEEDSSQTAACNNSAMPVRRAIEPVLYWD